MARTGDVNGRRINLGTRIRPNARLARAALPHGTFILMPHPEGNVLIDRRTLLPTPETLRRYRVDKKEARDGQP